MRERGGGGGGRKGERERETERERRENEREREREKEKERKIEREKGRERESKAQGKKETRITNIQVNKEYQRRKCNGMAQTCFSRKFRGQGKGGRKEDGMEVNARTQTQTQFRGHIDMQTYIHT